MKFEIGNGEFHVGDCFDVMRELPDSSVNMILCDLPYGTTQNKWDSVLPLDELWREYWRIAKPDAAVVLSAQTPFDKVLGCSQLDALKYEWIWKKEMGTGHLNAKKQPMKFHENILVFYRRQCTYNPQFEAGKPYKQTSGRGSSNYGSQHSTLTVNDGVRYPGSVQIFPRDREKIHPTQKPVALFEYLIRTYTNPTEVVLDNTAGSGTTAVAAESADRRWICIERDEDYAAKAMERIRHHVSGEVSVPKRATPKKRSAPREAGVHQASLFL